MTRYAPDDDEWPMRTPHPTDRWLVAKARGELGWYTGPVGLGVYAVVATRRRWIFFKTWADAFAYARARTSTTAASIPTRPGAPDALLPR